jgi:biopolymer transport protein ExbB
MPSVIEQIFKLQEAGGIVLPPLTLMALVLWYALGLRRASIAQVARELKGNLPLSEPSARMLTRRLRAGAAVIVGIVATAPLLGLLGTVGGMIETFDSLGSMALFSKSGGIAGGVSEALFSTQMGLVVAIPGAIAGRLLERKSQAIELDVLARSTGSL